jgi:hypothetical protein
MRHGPRLFVERPIHNPLFGLLNNQMSYLGPRISRLCVVDQVYTLKTYHNSSIHKYLARPMTSTVLDNSGEGISRWKKESADETSAPGQTG